MSNSYIANYIQNLSVEKETLSTVPGFEPGSFDCRSIALTLSSIHFSDLAWIILPLQFTYESKYFFFRSWNLFIFVCCLPAELIALLLFFFPETPKYLAETGQNVKLLKVLGRMYEENSGHSSNKYFVS